MNTQAIPGPANLLASAPASGNAAVAPDAAEVPFNQVLQREVTERRSADQPSKSESGRSAEKSAKRETTQANAGAGKSESVAAKDKEETVSTGEAEELSEASNVSAELLALVANMAQIHTSAADAKPAESSDATALQLDPAAELGKGKPLALDTEEQAPKAKHGDDSGLDLLNAKPDLVQTAKDAGKASSDTAQSQQFSLTQPTALQSGAIPSDSATALQSGLMPEAGTTQASVLAPMQLALNKVHAASTQAADTLAPPVGTPAWDQAVGQKIVWMVGGAQQSASLSLNPPDLGPMQIVLNVSNSQANATFVAAQPEVRQALEAALPKLREMLGDAGIQLGQTNINAGNPQQGQGFDRGGKPASSHFSHADNGEQPIAPVRSQTIRQGVGMVDTFA
ncbi:MAG: flagellar hook-length control protein FliK [Burkholderiaceae bacterium]